MKQFWKWLIQVFTPIRTRAYVYQPKLTEEQRAHLANVYTKKLYKVKSYKDLLNYACIKYDTQISLNALYRQVRPIIEK